MARHPEYKYQVGKIDKENLWIYVEDVNESGWRKEISDCWSDRKNYGPIELLLRIKERNNWSIKEVGELQYRFVEDELNIVFQWDDLFGFVIIVDDIDKVDEVKMFIKEFCFVEE